MVDLTFILGKRHEKFSWDCQGETVFYLSLFYNLFFSSSEQCQETTSKLSVGSDLRTRLKSEKVVLLSSL